jgi:hypothetical protein
MTGDDWSPSIEKIGIITLACQACDTTWVYHPQTTVEASLRKAIYQSGFALLVGHGIRTFKFEVRLRGHRRPDPADRLPDRGDPAGAEGALVAWGL